MKNEEAMSGMGFMLEGQEKMRLAARDRAIAETSARNAIEQKVGDVYDIEDPREFVQKFTHAAIEAAYLAIQADREQYHLELKYLDKAMNLHLQDLSSRPLPQYIVKAP